MAPPFRADHIGSLLRPQELKNAFRDAHLGKIDKQTFQEIQDRCIREAIKLQEDAGLRSITDGEFRRGSWFFGFVQAVDGLTTKDSIFTFHDEAGGDVVFQSAYVAGPLKRARGITTDEFSFVQANSRGAAKVTMPTPSLVHFFRLDDAADRSVYPDPKRFWADLIAVYRAEIEALGQLGCRFVQLDEVPIAMLCDPKIRDAASAKGGNPEQLLAIYIDAINQVAAAKSGNMRIWIAPLQGKLQGALDGRGQLRGGRSALVQRSQRRHVFPGIRHCAGRGFEPLRHLPKTKNVVLGLISSKTPQLEPLDHLRKRLDEAARFVDLDQVGVSPQCGFASSVGGNPLSIEDERKKLARLVELAHAVWG